MMSPSTTDTPHKHDAHTIWNKSLADTAPVVEILARAQLWPPYDYPLPATVRRLTRTAAHELHLDLGTHASQAIVYGLERDPPAVDDRIGNDSVDSRPCAVVIQPLPRHPTPGELMNPATLLTVGFDTPGSRNTEIDKPSPPVFTAIHGRADRWGHLVQGPVHALALALTHGWRYRDDPCSVFGACEREHLVPLLNRSLWPRQIKLHVHGGGRIKNLSLPTDQIVRYHGTDNPGRTLANRIEAIKKERVAAIPNRDRAAWQIFLDPSQPLPEHVTTA